jgi:protoporphyrinogen oxidase
MSENHPEQKKLVIIGAGPAGLTAALGLSDHGLGPKTVVLEGDSVVGGISRTVERDGWRFDIGGHRFFTKVKEVDDLWHRILPPEDFLMRPRMSRIFYKGKYYDYPLKAMNALRNLGVLEAFRCVLSYAWVRIRPPKDQSTFEGWTASRFGWRLYFIFFKTYTEKVWGVPANEIQADWAAQRIKNLSLGNAIINAILPKRNQKEITSLIEEFQYPKFGPGMMWERCAELVTAKGVQIEMNAPVVQINRDSSGVCSVIVQMRSGERKEVPAESLISSMPINQLVQVMEPPAPSSVLKAAQDLKHRDFLTVALVVPEKFAFPDNWIYIHSPEARVGRIQNFGSWSPFLIKEGRTCLGLEYFVSIGDDLWEMDDEKLIALGSSELEKLGIITSSEVIEVGYVVRMPRAYPVYDKAYQENIEIIKDWIALEIPNVYPVGRNGMHKYNNQDHSMMTAILSVENIAAGASHDIWSVNVEEEYHETGSSAGTGRSAPVIG